MPNLEYMQGVYEYLHKHPELSEAESRTAEFVAKELRKLGFKVREKIGGEGVVGILDFAKSGSTLALRCDMDALGLQEETNVPYASTNPGVMHACGHDSHMTIVLGACAYAAQNKEQLRGCLMAIFQPAEENVVGAKAMLKDGIFADFRPDRLIGIHNWPSLPAGSIGLQEGPMTAFADRFKVTVLGEGGHGGFPHKTKDPIAMAAAGVQNTFALIQRNSDANYPQTLSFGIIQGGASFNVIPTRVVLEGSFRTLRREDQKLMLANLEQAFKTAAQLHGGSYDLDYRQGVPAVENCPEVVAELVSIFEEFAPEIPLVRQGLTSLIGEDLAYFLHEIPGVLLLIGSGQEGQVNELHHPRFLVPQQSLQTGYQALTSIIKRLAP